MLLRVLLDGRGDAAVGVAFAQHGIHGAAEHLGVPRLDAPSRRRCAAPPDSSERRSPAACSSLIAACELRHRRADVRQLDDVGFGRLRDLAELGEVVADGLVLREPLGELREDASGERDVARLDRAACGLRERLHDRQQRVGRERRRFVGERVDDLRVVHGPCVRKARRRVVSGAVVKGSPISCRARGKRSRRFR